jgi:hypothetical protein
MAGGGLLDPNAQAQPPAAAPSQAPAPDPSQAQADPSQGQGDSGQGDEPDQQPNVTPEEQAAYDKFVKHALMLMYGGGQVRPGILHLLDNDPKDLIQIIPTLQGHGVSPIIRLAATAVVVTMQTVRDTSEQDGAIILHGGKAILEDLAEISQKAGIHDYSDAEVNEAFRVGADLYREAGQTEGLVNLNEAKDEFQQIVTADKSGKLGDVLPPLQQVNDAVAAQQQQQPQDQAAQDQQQLPPDQQKGQLQ